MGFKIDNETGDILLKAVGAVLVFFTFRWMIKIFSRADGVKGMTQAEFLKLAAFVLFYGGIIFILYIEAYRTTVEHRFGDFWLVFMITGLFSVLHMTEVLDKMGSLIDLLIRLRSKIPAPTTETTTSTSITQKETKKTTDENP